jgi:hypothetical protein
VSMATFDHASTLYGVFERDSTTEEIDGVRLPVWRGSMVEAYKSIGASQHYYSGVMDTLKDLGCITVLSSGRRARPSVVALHHAPDEVEFIFYSESRLTGAPEAAKLRSRLELLERRIGGVNIADALVNIDKRVARLEHLVGKAQEFQTNQTQTKE